jgi:capsular polysaccharide biosynthesis protein
VFLVADETVVGMDVTAPYEFSLDTTQMQDGPHSLWIRAWQAGKAIDSARVRVTVKNVAAPPVEPPPLPPPPPTIPCSISAPASVTIPRNGSGVIAVTLQNVSSPVEVKVIGSDGQVTVSPLTWNAGPTSTVKQFQVRVKKQSRTITFQSGCGVVVVKVNVTG